MGKWTVSPETTIYPLTYGGEEFTITVKKLLNAGEKKRLEGSGFRNWRAAEDADQMELRVNVDALVFEKVNTWMTEWSLSENGKPLPKSLDSLRALHPGVFAVIEEKVDEHAKAVADAAKKADPPATVTSNG